MSDPPDHAPLDPLDLALLESIIHGFQPGGGPLPFHPGGMGLPGGGGVVRGSLVGGTVVAAAVGLSVGLEVGLGVMVVHHGLEGGVG